MANEGKARKQIARGKQAEALTNNEILNECFEKIEKQIFESWRGTLAGEADQRHNAYLMQRLLQNLKDQIALIARTGKDASKLLEIEKNAGNGNG